MKNVKLAIWVLDVDVEKTLHFNQNKLEVCDCLYCQNFSAVIQQKHPLLREKLLELGIEAATPNHVSYFPGNKDGQQLAIGNYQFSGTLLEGKWSTMEDWNAGNTAEVDGMQIGLSKEMELLPDNFPEPVIQVNFEFSMPWVLEEDPEESQ
ncbi:hypothetical protein [Planococcus sp. CAU13]|uniref:hypothetical protein n=1 Tax=Planococcus sp. CAU13 TaxID=1541197 RepID=UPI00052FEC2F|nr:hypothetical protein [Planococcus sp. CAU13]